MKVKSKHNIHNHIVDDCNHQNLMPNKIYEVIGLDDEYYRIINELSEPVLYPKGLFDIIDSYIPNEWVQNWYSDNEYYIDPPELAEPGFYEDYFDGKIEAIETFKQFLSKFNLQ
jgi:hypothetical protein